MTKRDKRLLCATLALFLAPHLIVWSWDAEAGKAAESAQQAVVEAVPAVSLSETLPAYEVQPWSIEDEDPEEDEKITTALEAQGYYRPDVPLSYDLQDNLHTACETYNVPYELALGLIEVESNFDVDASNGRCYGLCQLNAKYHPANLTPTENIWAGMEYLGYQLERYSTVEAALEGYHAGHDTGARGYARAVLAAAERWK